MTGLLAPGANGSFHGLVDDPWCPQPMAADKNVRHREEPGGVWSGPPTPKQAQQLATTWAELEGDFELISDDYVGPRLPNQITAAEKEQIVRLYDSIRRQTGDLIIDSSQLDRRRAPAWRAGMMREVRSLLQTASGRELLFNLNDNVIGADAATNQDIHRQTRIKPLFEDDTLQTQAHVDAHAKLNYDNAFNEAANEQDAALRADDSAGPGSDVTIFMNPGAWIPSSGPYVDPWLFNPTGQKLMHEGKHAYDKTHGRFDGHLVEDKDGVTEDQRSFARGEHAAIGIGRSSGARMTENAFRAEHELLKASGRLSLARDGSTVPRRHYRRSEAPPANSPAPDASELARRRAEAKSHYIE